MNEYPASVTGSTEPLKTYKCLRWEQRLVVSEEELAVYEKLLADYPEMVSEEYEPYEQFCAEYSDEEMEPLWIKNIPDWAKKLERYDVPLTKFYGSPE